MAAAQSRLMFGMASRFHLPRVRMERQAVKAAAKVVTRKMRPRAQKREMKD